MSRIRNLFLSTALSAACSSAAIAGTVSPVQSGATPFGLQPIADVQLRGSDSDAADFQTNDLPGLQAIVNNTLTESQSINNLSSIALNPNDLVISGDSEVRAYFIGEGAGYRNSLGIYTGDSSDGINGDASLIFPDASTTGYYSYYNSDYRSSRAPVAPGDFVDLGTYTDGTQLNLFLVANGAGGGTNTYFTDMELNSDGIDHFVMLATPDNPYLLIGVEDLHGGGDEDYNDVVVALEVGVATTRVLMAKAVPLPAPVAALLGPVLFGVILAVKRRHRKGFNEAVPT